MKKLTKKRRLDGAAARFIENQLASGRVAFSLNALVKKTGLSAIAAKNQLLRLGEQVTRVTRVHQFFLIVTPEHRAIGAPPPAWWLDDYFEWLGHPYYVGVQSGAEIYGSSSQALQVTQVVTDAPRREIQVGRIRVQFFVKRRVARTPTRPLANAFAPLRVSTPAATVFDLIRYAARLGGFERAMETLAPIIPLIHVPDLKAVLKAEDEVAMAQRLGYILDIAGKSELADVVERWLPPHLDLMPLSKSSPTTKAAQVVQRWRILNNAPELAI
ncbi:MAG TPA: type IV toxin-antitoxin system AbiEi family antitoxin [Verrucomicrobiae bacterium]|nr:type IV toxin-antitoxin system AbiEi family antitoxin [Verrucomicrobiae bacterium]